MKALLLALVLSQTPVDAPVAALVIPPMALDTQEAVLLDIRAVKAGDPAPADGAWMDNTSLVAVARRTYSCEEERAALRDGWTPLWVAGIALGSFALGAGAAFLVLRR